MFVRVLKRPLVILAFVCNSLAPLRVSGQTSTLNPEVGGGNATAQAVPRGVIPANWLPPDVDENIPPVEPSTPCALDDVLQKAGQRIKELVSNVDRFTATESLVHERINKSGIASAPQTLKFDYVVSIEEIRPGILNVEEYRSSRSSAADFLDGVASRGLPAMVLRPLTIVVFSWSTFALTAATSAVEGRPKHSVQTSIFVDGKWCAAL